MYNYFPATLSSLMAGIMSGLFHTISQTSLIIRKVNECTEIKKISDPSKVNSKRLLSNILKFLIRKKVGHQLGFGKLFVQMLF